jgi:hypothetical protein
MNYSKEKQLLNNVQAYNQLVKALKNIHKALNEYRANNDIKYKVDGTFYEKNDKEITAIIEKYRTYRQRFTWTCRKSFILSADTHYQVAESGCCYLDLYIDLNKPFTHKTVRLNQVQAKIKKLCTLVNKKKEIENKIAREKQGFSSFGLVQDASKRGWV